MTRFHVYKTDNFDGLALDCQADVLGDLTTRFVLPLVAEADIRRTYSHLNPTFTIEDRRYVLAPQGAATISRRSIVRHVASLEHEQSAIMNALDMLLTGY